MESKVGQIPGTPRTHGDSSPSTWRDNTFIAYCNMLSTTCGMGKFINWGT